MDCLRRDSYTGANWRRSYDIRDRDARDTARLTMAADATLLDTSTPTVEASVAKAITWSRRGLRQN
jgi:cytidylate kinase